MMVRENPDGARLQGGGEGRAGEVSVQRWAGDASQRRAYRLGLDFLNSRGPVVVLELVDEVGDAPRLGG